MTPTTLTAYSRSNATMTLQKLDEFWQMMDNAFDNLPTYREIVEYVGEKSKPIPNELGIARMRISLLAVSFNEQYEVEIEDEEEDDEDVILEEFASGYVALKHAADALHEAIMYVIPLANTDTEMPMIRSDMERVFETYKNDSARFLNGHWYVAGGLAQNYEDFFTFLWSVYRLQSSIETQMK